MKALNFRPSFLQIVYFLIVLILFSFIIYTPTFIGGPVSMTEKLIFKEETIEGSLLGVLFILSIIILNIYKREVYNHRELIKKSIDDKKKVEDRLLVSDQYIGAVNVQIQKVESIFNSIDRYPQTKADFKKTMSFFGDCLLGILNSNWALIRIINSNTQKTIIEHFQTKERFPFIYPHISNKMIIEKQPMLSYTTVISNPNDLNILAFCTMPVDKINKDQRVFIQAIINVITMLFVILNSLYLKNENKIFVDNSINMKTSPKGLLSIVL